MELVESQLPDRHKMRTICVSTWHVENTPDGLYSLLLTKFCKLVSFCLEDRKKLKDGFMLLHASVTARRHPTSALCYLLKSYSTVQMTQYTTQTNTSINHFILQSVTHYWRSPIAFPVKEVYWACVKYFTVLYISSISMVYSNYFCISQSITLQIILAIDTDYQLLNNTVNKSWVSG